MAWSKDSWRGKPAKQMPTYADAEALAATEARLAQTQTTTTLTVVADRGLDARQLVRTIADAQAAGFQDVRVITERGQAK